MQSRDYRGIIGGAILILIGMSFAISALTSLHLGTIMRMGPGMLPSALGSLLVALGISILISAIGREGKLVRVDLLPLLSVSMGILAFAMTIRPFGLVPAVALTILISSRADSKLTMIGALALTVALSLFAYFIFHISLGLPLQAFAWPW